MSDQRGVAHLGVPVFQEGREVEGWRPPPPGQHRQGDDRGEPDFPVLGVLEPLHHDRVSVRLRRGGEAADRRGPDELGGVFQQLGEERIRVGTRPRRDDERRPRAGPARRNGG